MRKRAKKLLALLTAVTITVTGVNVPAAQAAKVKVTASKTTLYYNGTSAEKKATVTVKNVKGKKVTYSISKAGKKIVKLGDVSGNKTKKFTVTAKKKGTAKVTVKVAGKKVKTIKFTVKKKTAKATPKPTVAPSQAPTQEPSQEPSQEPTVAPSDEPTVAPTDAPSDAPTVAPTDEPTKAPEKSVVTEIKILDDVAVTDKDGKEAYVYYDVLDQYGESMRESTSIKWTTSPANGKAAKATGKITIPKGTTNFKYGDQIYIVGVEPKTGVSVTKSVTVGLQQQLDKVSFEGFVKASDKNTKLKDLGKDFATGSDPYYLLYKSYDQNGHEMEYSDDLAKDVLFTADNPMLLKLETDAKLPSVTIGEDTYSVIKVIPQLYADKGGEVNITAISQKTGNKVTQNFVVGDAGVLASFEILEPKDMVTDGNQDVEVPFIAKDTAGNEITNYETIVRSTNSLSLTAGAGTIKLAEANDGTAKLTWCDETNDTFISTYQNSTAWDGVARPVSLTSVVIGGKGSTIIMSVEDARIPEKVSIDDITLSSKSKAELKTKNVFWDEGSSWSFVDQYGKALSYRKAAAFLLYAYNNPFGADKANYKLRMQAVNAKDIISDVATADVYNFDLQPIADKQGWGEGGALIESGMGQLKFDFTACQVTAEKTATIKTSIIKIVDEDIDNVQKATTSKFTVVPLDKMSGFFIDGLSHTLRLNPAAAKFTASGDTVSATDKLAGNAAVLAEYIPAIWGNGTTLAVKGTYNGTALSVANEYLNWTNENVTVDNDNNIIQVNQGAIKRGDAYDMMTYANPAKVFDLDVNVQIDQNQDTKFDKADTSAMKSASFSFAAPVVTAVTFAVNNNGGPLCPANMAYGDIFKDVTVTDQFGHRIDGKDVIFTITNIKENTDALAHKANSLEFIGAGTTSVSLKGAEIGDKFDLTGTVKGTKVSSTLSYTLGADTEAYISNEKDSDKDFREKHLGYEKR